MPAPNAPATLPPDHDDGAELETSTEAPPRTRRTRQRRQPPDSVLDELDDGAMQEEARIQEILSDELNNAANLELYRKDRVGKWAFLTTTPLADWNAEAKDGLAKKYGGGEYKGRVRRMADGVRGSWGPSFIFSIDSSLKPEAEAAAPAGGVDMRELTSLIQGSDKTMPLFMQMMQMQQASTQLMLTQMQESQKTLVTVLTAALTRPATPPPPAPSEKLIEILAAKAFNPAPQRGISDLAEVIKAVAQLKNIANADKGNLDDEGRERPGVLDSLIEAVPSLLKMFGGMMSQPEPLPAQPAQVQPLPAQSAALAPIRVPEPAAEVRPEPYAPVAADIIDTGPVVSPRNHDVEPQDVQALAGILPSLVQLADQGRSPEEVAAQIDQALPDALFLRMVDLLKRPDWMAVLIDAHEPVQVRTPFFTGLRDELIALSEDDGTD